MKSINKLSLFCIFLFCYFSSLEAATITWLGGNSSWQNPAQWDTGTVPTIGDDVIIPSGYCKIYSGLGKKVRSVKVQSSARLYIYNGGTLNISGAVDEAGLHNMGRVFIYGDLEISNINLSNSSQNAYAIKNERIIKAYANSEITINYIDDIALYNLTANSYFQMRGSLSINDVDKIAIINNGGFYNLGNIDIENSGESNSYLISNSSHFINYGIGVINLKSDIYGGIANGLVTSDFKNFGYIYTEDVNVGIFNDGLVTNYSGALMDFQNIFVTSFFNRESGSIFNHGFISSSNCNSGIFNYGQFTNHKSFIVFDGITHSSLKNYSTGTIQNYSYIYLNADGPYDLYNEGEIVIHNGGSLSINKILINEASGTISNYGFINSFGDVIHQINGTITNDGFIDDDYGNIQGLITNNKVIVAPVSGPMQNGIAYPNVLDVASLTDVGFGDWKTSPNGAIAGTYNEVNNEFTPNASAVGLSTLIIYIEDLSTGNAKNFSLEIGSPILPFASKKKVATTRHGQTDEYADNTNTKVQVFPNPSIGTIQLESDAFEVNTTQIQIFNPMGQLVQQERLAAGNISQSLEFSSQLDNGLYIVKLIQNGDEMKIKKIKLQR